MKEKHSGINKKVNNKTRALLALLVATAFLLPAGAIVALDPTDDKSIPDEQVPWEFTSTMVDEQISKYTPVQDVLQPDIDDAMKVVNLETGETLGEIRPGEEPPSDQTGTRFENPLFEQIVHDSTDGWSMGTSDAGMGYKMYDNFWGVTSTIGPFTFDALALIWTGAGWNPGDPTGMVFNVGFYSDDIGIMTEPTTPALTGQFTTDVYTPGQSYAGYPAYQWESPDTGIGTVVLDEGWFSVQSASSPSSSVILWGSAKTGDGYSYQAGSTTPNTAYDRAFALYEGGPAGEEYEWNAVVKYIYIEDEIWDPEIGEYRTVPKIIHTPHEQACKNEYIHDWVETWIDQFAPEGAPRCNRFTPGELYLGAEIGNHGNNTYINLPVHLNIWKQIYDDILVSDFESHVFSDWVAIDGGGCVHPYPDGDTWNISTARYHSGGQSMHVSKTASYMKGANDTLRNRYPLNTHGGDCAEVSFWFWVEGDYDSYPWKAYDYLTVYWIQKPHDGPEIRHGPLDVKVVEPGPVWYWSEQTDWSAWGGDHGQPLCYNSGGPAPVGGNYNDPEWSKGILEIPDDWKCDQTFVEFVWKADCMTQFEGAYIDDVVISRVINQGEKVYTAAEQVTLAPGEQKFLRFTPPWGECCPIEHGKYWIECRVKTHSNFVPDEEPADDWIKDEVIIECHHDVGVTEVNVWPHKQTAGEVFSYLIPTNVSFTVKNFSPYDDEFDVKMTVNNMEYEDIFIDDVEGGNLGWGHTGFGGPDLWHISTRDAKSPTHSWAAMESDVGFYDNDMSNYLYSPTLNFEGLKDAYVCWDAKWALEAGDYWYFIIYDPYSNFLIGIGGNPSQYDWGKCSGQWLPDYDGHPVWIGPGNAGTDYLISGSGLIGARYNQMCMDIKGIIEDLNLDGPSWLGIEMFGPYGDPEYRAGFGFALFSDGSGRESACNVEKWSGLYIDNVEVIGVRAGEVVAEETWHVMLPGQGGEQTIDTKYCWDGIWGDFEVDIETFLETDCTPENNWMDGYNHIYYTFWGDDAEDYTYYDEHPYEDGWTHVDLKQEGDSAWHIVNNIDPVEGYQEYWWCGIEGDIFYGANWNDCMISPEFDLYSLIPRDPWCDPAVQLVFRMCAHLDIGDSFYVEISNDSGRNWFILDEWHGPWQSNCWNDYEYIIPLNYYTKGFMFRFRFNSDGYYENKGILLDDIILQALKGQCCPDADFMAEDFGTWPPAGWSVDTFDQSFTSNAGGESPEARLYWAYANGYGDTLMSPVFDTSAASSLTLEFKDYKNIYSAPLYFYVEVFDGSSWVDITPWDNPTSEEFVATTWTIDISAYASTQTQVRFVFDDYYFNLNYWYIDDVLLYGTADCTYGDPLAWYFEDDAETGGNPLWDFAPDYGGDLWHPYCYPIYHDPVYGQFGEIVSPILEACPDENYLPISEPWVLDYLPDYAGGDNTGEINEHFWMCEKHHKTPYDDGLYIWPYCSYTYLNNMDNILISPEIDLQGTYHAHVSFWYTGSLGVGDEFWVMVREKNDDGTWGPWNYMRELNWMTDMVDYETGTYSFYPWQQFNQLSDTYNFNNPIRASPAFMVNLFRYVRDQSIIQLGFRLISDEAGVGPGIKIDHISIDAKLDEIAPTTTCAISGTMGCNDWYTSSVAVTLTGTDDRVGVKETYYRIDGGAWQLYNERFQVSADGAHTIEYYSVDAVGNVEDIKTCQSFKIDQTNPTVALAMPESGYLYIGGRPIFQIGRTIVVGDLTAQASASDATSGIDYVEFLVDGEVKSADLTAPYTFDLPFSFLPSSHTLQVKAYDNACNTGTGTQTTYLKWL